MAMASKSLPAILIISLIFILTPFVFINSASAHSHAHQITNHSSPYGFIKHLQGCHKGDKHKGLHDLKKYLKKFGYLNYNVNPNFNQTHLDNDDFDDTLESAIKTYQQNYHLSPTGVLDEETVSTMTRSRCGVADIINGTNWMRPNKKRHRHNRSTHFHTVSHYKFFEGEQKWRVKTRLTYGFPPGTITDAVNAVARAFKTWAANTHFTFSWTNDYENADLKSSFQRGNHGDDEPFTGPTGALAHAFAPEDGRFHYNADYMWAVGAVQGWYDLETVALHEIGHLLGLMHSDVEGAIMWPTIPSGSTKGLHKDDIDGIRDLYNV